MPILFTVVLIDLIGFGIVIPILPFLSPTLGADKMDIAYIISVYAVCAGISGPFWGRLSDRAGRKPVIIICLAGGALSYVMLGLATSLWMIFAARGFAGIMAGNLGVASAMMADITSPEERAKGMGLIGAAFGLGIVLGPVLGGLLSGENGGFMLPCLVAGLMSVLAILAALIFLPESLHRDRQAENRREQRSAGRLSLYQLLRNTGSRLITLQFVLHSLAVSSITYLFPLWAGDTLGWSAREVGLMFGVQGAIMVLFQGALIGPLTRLAGDWRLLCICISAFLLGLFGAASADTMVVMVGSMYVAMTGATMCMPLLNTIVTRNSPIEYRGRLLGTTSAASSWGRVAGPLMAGFNLGVFGYGGAYLGSAAVVCLYLAWALYEYLRQGARPPGNVQGGA